MKKHRKKIIIFSVLGAIIILVSAFAVVQRDNISALIKAFNYSEEDLSKMMADNKEKLEKELEEKVPEMVSDFSEEDEKKIMSGELSLEEAVKLKEKELEEKKSASNVSKDEKTSGIVSKKVIEFYSLKAYYLGQLGQLEAKAIADYKALPENKRNLVGKKEVVGKYMSVATSLLAQCDGRVEGLLKELEGEIKAAGGDLSVISTIRSAYENEKNLKKAYYMSKLK